MKKIDSGFKIQAVTLKTKRIFLYFGGLLFAVLVFLTGFYCGIEDYKSELIAVKHIDGKYGKAFYGVEVSGKDCGNRIEIYAKIHIGGVPGNYIHDCGKIGTSKNWKNAKEEFGNISFDGSVLTIGTYAVKKEQYENHR